jgi:hypothetical protein
MSGSYELGTTSIDVRIDALISEKSPQRGQRLDGTWMNQVPLRTPRTIKPNYAVSIPLVPLCRALTVTHGYGKMQRNN